jgi:hypothetical protein
LKNCDKIFITHQRKALAIYLTCWLAGQLNWKPLAFQELENHTILNFSSGEKEILCHLTAQENSDALSDSLSYLKIEGENHCTWEFTQDTAKAQVTVHYTEDTFCSLPEIFPVKNLQNGLNLAKNILFSPCSNHYYNMLNTLQEFDLHER